MSCEKFDERLQQLLDQRLEPAIDRELQRHAEECGECRSLLESQDRLFSAFGFGTEGGAGLPENFTAKLVAAIVAERPAQRRWERSAWAVALMAVASLLLLAFLPGLRADRLDRVSPSPSGGGVLWKTTVPMVPVVVETKEIPSGPATAPEALAVASTITAGTGGRGLDRQSSRKYFGSVARKPRTDGPNCRWLSSCCDVATVGGRRVAPYVAGRWRTAPQADARCQRHVERRVDCARVGQVFNSSL